MQSIQAEPALRVGLIHALGLLVKRLLALTLMPGLLVACQRDAPLPPQQIDFNHNAPDISVSAFDGALLGFDDGEWGGKLAYRDASGKVLDIVPENVRAILPRNDGFIVFTGLSHLGTNEGSIYSVSPDAEDTFKIFLLHKLDGAPNDIVLDSKSDEIRFAVFTGMDDRRTQPGKWIYACKVMHSDYQISVASGCREPQP